MALTTPPLSYSEKARFAQLLASYNAALPTVADGIRGELQMDVNGRLLTSPRLSTAADQFTIAGGIVVADCRLRDANGADLQVISPTGGINQLRANINEATGAIANWNTQTIAVASPQTYGLLDARHFKELVILANITAVTTGVTFSYQVQDGNSTLVTVWSETFASTGIQYICLGPGYTGGTGRNMSVGVVSQLTVAAVGTSAVIKGSAWLRSA